MRLVIATRNPGKLREFSRIIDVPGIACVGLDEFPDFPAIAEDGTSFRDNALIKAQAAAAATGLPALADDSGLAVDALQGRPGILSARYAGTGATDRMNWEKVLAELRDVPPTSRQARFVCAIAVVGHNRAFVAEGELAGVIVDLPRGENGFGYDPIFLLPQYGRTMAELDPAEKDRISHRAIALRRLRPSLALLARSID